MAVFVEGVTLSKLCAWVLERYWPGALMPTGSVQRVVQVLREQLKFFALI